MTIAYYRDLDSSDELIISTSQGIYALDLSTLRIGSSRRIGSVPRGAVSIGVSDVGRLLTIASIRAIKRCEDEMEASE